MKSHTPASLHTENIFPLPQDLPNLGKNVSAFGERIWKLQQESIRFLGERFEDNMKAMQRLTACRSLPDVLAAQQKWFAEAAQAYGEEWSRCADLMTDALKNGHDDGPDKAPRRNH
jgi:hypothetical protein